MLINLVGKTTEDIASSTFPLFDNLALTNEEYFCKFSTKLSLDVDVAKLL